MGYIHAHMEEPDHVYSGVYLADGEYGTMLYAGQLSKLWSGYGFENGDLIIAAGNVSPYSGLMEIKPEAMESAIGYEGYDQVKQPVTLNGNNLKWAADEKGEDSATLHQCAPVKITVSYVSGQVTAPSAAATLKFKTADNQNVDVYCNYHIGVSAMTSLMEMTKEGAIAEGDTFELTGVISVYDDKPNIIPMNGAESFVKVA